MILLIDAGNTRIKWARYEGDWGGRGDVPVGDVLHLAEVWRGSDAPSRVVVSNVAGAKVRSELALLLAHWHCPVIWVESRETECGVRNGYGDPAQLGSDRWAALIGARHRFPNGDVLVVSVGTAMTVDALTGSGEFLGGVIVPGMELMAHALHSKTAGVGQTAGGFANFPTTTGDAVYSGAVQAMTGAIERMHGAFCRQRDIPEVPCVLTGGGAGALGPLLNIPVVQVDNLVLEGLLRVAEKR